ncbi:MAG: hypothetical protein PHQ00_06310 [Phycisphaerae bacterium]|nr:hypothetical protein [Phycisphaerae bacterium]
MADDSYNLIKPIDNNQSIIGLTPAKKREERKKRQNMNKQQNRHQDEPSEPDSEKISGTIAGNDADEHSIDYYA